jgi:hypothetical protein
MSRLIDADALMDYCNNQKDKTIDANDIARFPTIGCWISVKDRMPSNDGTKVLTYGNPVTHWMPLPEPPKEDYNG